jgi:hypothetical protein
LTIRADNGMAEAGAESSAMQGDEVQKQVAEVAKALVQRSDELAVLRARAIIRRAWSSPLMLGCRRGAPPQITCTLSSVDVYSAWMGGCLQ